MTAFAERKTAIEAYCRLDDLTAEEEALLEAAYEDAVGYLALAGVTEPAEGTRLAQYHQCVNAMVLDAWDNRGSQSGDKALTENPAFQRRLNQLKLTEPVTEAQG